MSPVRVNVSYRGPFFGRPVGQLHRNAYAVLEEVTAGGASAAASQLTPGHGLVSGELQSSIEPRLVKASRGASFTGHARVIAGSRGHEPVRRYAGKIERKYHFMARAAAAARSWVESNKGRIAALLVRGVS